jgi:hypothetical protein
MPVTALEIMTETGLPGISRGKRKLRKTATNRVKKYHVDFFRKYFCRPFKSVLLLVWQERKIKSPQGIPCGLGLRYYFFNRRL